jgi:hypothetical protein
MGPPLQELRAGSGQLSELRIYTATGQTKESAGASFALKARDMGEFTWVDITTMCKLC